MDKKYKSVYSKVLSSPGNPRYVIINTETGEVVDDAQGYGFKSAQKAYACFVYKNASPEEKKKRNEAKKLFKNGAKNTETLSTFWKMMLFI